MLRFERLTVDGQASREVKISHHHRHHHRREKLETFVIQILNQSI